MKKQTVTRSLVKFENIYTINCAGKATKYSPPRVHFFLDIAQNISYVLSFGVGFNFSFPSEFRLVTSNLCQIKLSSCAFYRSNVHAESKELLGLLSEPGAEIVEKSRFLFRHKIVSLHKSIVFT